MNEKNQNIAAIPGWKTAEKTFGFHTSEMRLPR